MVPVALQLLPSSLSVCLQGSPNWSNVSRLWEEAAKSYFRWSERTWDFNEIGVVLQMSLTVLQQAKEENLAMSKSDPVLRDSLANFWQAVRKLHSASEQLPLRQSQALLMEASRRIEVTSLLRLIAEQFPERSASELVSISEEERYIKKETQNGPIN